MLNSLTITKRLGLLIGSALLGIICLAAVFLFTERRLIFKERQDNVRHTVEVAHGLVSHFHGRVTKGELSEVQGKQFAVAAVRALRYGGSEYFWINDMHPRMVMHATKPELDGADLSQNKDPDGKRLFVAFVDAVKAGGSGFVDYQWPKPGSDKPVPKVSYVMGFEPWGWVIGSGVYIDTVDATIAGRVLGFSAGSLVLAAGLLGIGLLIARSVLHDLGGEPRYANEVAQRIAAGDLGADIVLKRGDDSSVLHAINNMREGLRALVGRVREGSESLATSSTQIAQGNLDLSQRTEQQAASLEETAASMEQLGSTVRQTAESAKRADALAHGASTIASKGGEVVAQVVETMKGINESSDRIADIIGVIDSIAFQTNILALNAAVEAARAGEQGRGFAVVASEVRSLASRSAEAAREIKKLIGDSQGRVERGTTLVEQARVTMNEVVNSIGQVTALMVGISAASAEQSLGVAQVGAAVTQMDHTTQQNAALVEESAAAAESLRAQARRLVQAVAAFKLS
jgi:methyl-accepting chemotaxis protein